MATAHVALVTVQGRAYTGSTMPVPDSIPAWTPQTMTTDATSTESTVKAPDTDWQGLFWEIGVDAAHYAAMGVNPEAGPNLGHFLPVAGVYGWAVMGPGEEIAVRTA